MPRPPRLREKIRPASRSFTLGFTGSERMATLLRMQIDAAFAEYAVTGRKPLRIVVCASNHFGEHLLVRADALRSIFPGMIVVALTYPVFWSKYLDICARRPQNEQRHAFDCADEVVLLPGNSAAAMRPQMHRMLLRSCDAVVEAYAARKYALELYRTAEAENCSVLASAEFTPGRIRTLAHICRMKGISLATNTAPPK